MKTIGQQLIALLLLLAAATMAYGQAGSNELVSQRMADAINSGKFYFKIHGISTDTDEYGQAIRMAATSSLAVKDKVSMSRMDDFKMVSISANGYTYTLDEQQKSYYATKDEDEANMDIGTLTFSRQGTCQLNGAEYYYDEWRRSSGAAVTFYYNTTRVAAIDFGIPGISSGAMSILSFDTRIPADMYFCLGKEWKENDMMGGIGANIDVNQYLTPDLLKSLEGSLPEGMDINAIMAQAGVGQGAGGTAAAIPPPPACSTPWTDNSPSVELGAGVNLGDLTAARRYADRAVALEPDYGLAFQLLTSLNLKEKLYVLAAETLFKSARSYFSDITACQFFSLKMALRQGADGSFLLDARQYWCLDMWLTYYRLLYDYTCGNMAGSNSDGGLTGNYPPAYEEMVREKEAITKAHLEDHSDYMKSLISCGEALGRCQEKATTERQERECGIAYLRCILPHNRRFVRDMYAAEIIKEMEADRKFYTSTVQPVLEEWWLKMNAMTGYCDNLNMQEYFLTETIRDINYNWQRNPLMDGWLYGQAIDSLWIAMVVNLEAEIGIQQSYVDQMPADPPKLTGKSDIRLANYGEKDKMDFNVGIRTPFGRVSFAREDNHYKFGTENTVTGTTKIHNLTNGEETSYTTYASLAHTPEPSKGYLQTFAEWAAFKGTEKMIDAVGRRQGLGMNTDASDFVPFTSTQTGIQRMRTLDSEGNVTDSGIVKFRERSFGIGDVGASVRQTQIRTGNSIRTMNHARLNFHFVDVQVGR